MLSKSSQPDRFDALTQAMTARRVPMLDVVRALAAALVVVDHYRLSRGLTGTVGVTMFFALSGYLITGLLLAENRKTGTISLPGFYRRRAFRIFPAFYVFWIVYVGLILLAGEQVPWSQALSSFFHYSNYYWGFTGKAPVMSITWSLSIEEQFYLLWPALFYVLRKDVNKLVMACAGIIAFSLGCRLLDSYVLHLKLEYVMYAFEARADSLIIGCLLAILVFSGKARPFVNLVAGQSWFVLFSLAGLALSGIYTLDNTYNAIWRSAVEAILSCVLMVQLLALPANSRWNWLNNRATRYFGQISYSVYLYHGLCRRFVEEVLGVHELYPVAILGVLCTLIVASTSFFLIEKTFVQLGKAKKIPAEQVEPRDALSQGSDKKPELARH